MLAVKVQNLSMAFGPKRVLDGIDLEVEKGEIVAIMGSSGGGKTTLLRCISGLLKPTSGSVSVFDIDVLKEPEAARRKMGMVFQSAALFDFLSVKDNVLFGAKRWHKLSKEDQSKVADEVLEAVGLRDSQDLMPSELSGGMRKRVGIARALALRPELMLYDEPTTGLDPITTYTIDQLMVTLRKGRGLTSLIVSHDVSSVFRTADRIAFLDAGRLSFVGTVDEFRKEKNEAIRELVEKAEAKEFMLSD